MTMVDLRTKYMGLELKNPIVPSASPLSHSLDNIRKMRDAGASAVVLFSLFEEQLKQEAEAFDYFNTVGTESYAEALSYFPTIGDYKVGPDQYLDLIQKASQAVDIPIIGSLNGISNQGWVETAKKMEQAGAKGIELNVYFIPTNPKLGGSKVEKMYMDVVKAVKASVHIPVAVKVGPYFSSMANIARKLNRSGADALVLFNRFYQPDFNLETLEVESSLNLSTPAEIRLPLRWIAILHKKVKASLAASTGVHSVNEVVKYLLAGADVVMTTSALLEKGIDYIGVLLGDLKNWMEQREYSSVRQMKGSMSQRNVTDATAFERANYIKIIESYKSKYSA